MRHLFMYTGLGLTLATGVVAAQTPAARITTIVAIDDDAPSRGQMPDAVPKPMTPPAGTGLPMPRPFAAGPNVTETRGPAAGSIPPPTFGDGGYPTPTGAWVGTPVPAGAMPVGPPMAADGGLFPTPILDAPLFDGGGALACPSPVTGGHKFYASAEYLTWWTQSARLPTLVTTGPASSNGILGAAGTQTLLGDDSFGQNRHSGVRVGLGYWFGCDQRWGLDSSLFVLGRNGQQESFNSGQFPLLARPFNNLNSGIPFSQLTAYPGLATGAIAVNYENAMWGADVDLRRRLCVTGCSRLDFLVGFRYVNLTEQLRIQEAFNRTPNSPIAIGSANALSGSVVDQFRTENEFYGTQVGLQGELRRGRWFLNATGKIALGTMHESVTISGAQSIQMRDGSTLNSSGGLLALPGANIGTYTQNKFAVAPEFGINLGFHITPHWRIYGGYNFLYLSSVLRPGDQIDRGLDATRIPNFPVANTSALTTVRPTVPLKDTGFFAQGLNFGMAYTW